MSTSPRVWPSTAGRVRVDSKSLEKVRTKEEIGDARKGRQKVKKLTEEIGRKTFGIPMIKKTDVGLKTRKENGTKTKIDKKFDREKIPPISGRKVQV
jgi:hypothetical protein